MDKPPLYIGNKKRCSKCHEYKDMATEYYKDAANKARKYAVMPSCKICCEDVRRQRIERNREYKPDFRILGNKKRCADCGQYKPFSAYWKSKKGLRGVDATCRECHAKDRKFKSPQDRFWKQFWPRTERVNTCLIWKGTLTGRGQPVCCYDGRVNTSVRRVIYRLALGELPDDMLVITTCNNSLCVSQSHLKKVTREEFRVKLESNAPKGDRNGSRLHPESVPRGDRHPHRQHPERLLRGDQHPRRLHPERFTILRGEQNGCAKLTNVEVRVIRKMYAEKSASQRELADQFGVTQSAISLIIRRESWAHVE